MGWTCGRCGYSWSDVEDVGVCPACGSWDVYPETDPSELGDPRARGGGCASAVLLCIALMLALLAVLGFTGGC